MSVGAVRSGRWGTLLAVAGLMLSLFLVALDQTVVGTALPKIIAEPSPRSLFHPLGEQAQHPLQFLVLLRAQDLPDACFHLAVELR